MTLVFANDNENWYIAGIQKLLKIFEIKIDGIQSAIQKFWYMNGIQAKKAIWNLIPTLKSWIEDAYYTK